MSSKKPEFEKISKEFNRFDRLINQLRSLSNNKYSGEKQKSLFNAIALLNTGVSSLNANFSSLFDSVYQRQILIEAQILEKNFGGDLHEQYHTVSNQVNTDLENLFTRIKSVTNRLPFLFEAILTHEEKRLLKFSSFGRFLNSLEKLNQQNNPLYSTFKTIYEGGILIDQENNDYRDKFIEHVKPNSKMSVLSTSGNGRVKRAHVALDEANEENRTKLLKTDWIKIQYDTWYSYMVHVNIDPKFELDPNVKQNEFLGRASDNGSGHFKKHGEHRHQFNSPNSKDGFQKNLNEESPEAVEITYKSLKYVNEYLETLITFIKK